MGSQQFCLRWNNHQVNMLNVFESLLHNEALVDVTLACEGLTLKAHKVVLSACSPFFQSMFIENPCKHPIVILKDVRFSDLKALIDFMYKGEVNVAQDQLNALLNTAETLKIKGLAEVTGGGVSVNPTHEPQLQLLPSRTHGGSSASCAPSSPPPPTLTVPPAHMGETAKHSTLPPPPHLQPLTNQLSAMGGQLSPLSPPPKRRKTKPRKRITESTLIPSDQEDSDALDLATTTTPEMIETCVDLPESSSEGERLQEPIDVKPCLPLLELPLHNQSQIKLPHYESSEDQNTTGDKSHLSTNQNQFALNPSSLSTQRLPILPKPQLPPVLPPSASSPIPSTSTTQASIQDIRRLCHFTRQSQKHKSPWTEEDMVAALEAVQCGRLTYALAARKFDIPKATLHYYVILMKAVEAVRSGRMTPEIAAIKYNVRASILIGCLYGADPSRTNSPPPFAASDKNDFARKEV